jgi:hypothetical protein
VEHRLNSLLDFSNLTLEPRYLPEGPGVFFCSLILCQPGAIQSPGSKPVLMKHVTQSKDLGSLISHQRGAIQSPSSKPVLMKHVTQ